MIKYPEIENMTKESWLILIHDGIEKGLVKVVDSDQLNKDYGTQGIVCNIGDNAFYCFKNADEYDDEDGNGLERFMKDFSQKEINEQIVDQLIAMQEEYEADFEDNGDKELYGEFEPEYSYYYSFLVNHL